MERVSYLFGDQLIWVLFAFAAALWLSGKIVTGMTPSTAGLFAGALLLTIFMTDYALLLAQDMAVALGILALIVIFSQWLFKLSIQGSLLVVVFAWIVGSVLINAVQGSLNIFNPWV